MKQITILLLFFVPLFINAQKKGIFTRPPYGHSKSETKNNNLRIWISSFIGVWNGEPIPNQEGRYAFSGPAGDCFGTDDRGFSSIRKIAIRKSRLYGEFLIDLKSRSLKKQVFLSQRTHLYPYRIPKLSCNYDTVNYDVAIPTSQVDRIKYDEKTKTLSFSFALETRNPLGLPSIINYETLNKILVPPIKISGEFKINLNTKEISFIGDRTDFPNFEIYCQFDEEPSITLYRYKTPHGATVFNLFYQGKANFCRSFEDLNCGSKNYLTMELQGESIGKTSHKFDKMKFNIPLDNIKGNNNYEVIVEKIISFESESSDDYFNIEVKFVGKVKDSKIFFSKNEGDFHSIHIKIRQYTLQRVLSSRGEIEFKIKKDRDYSFYFSLDSYINYKDGSKKEFDWQIKMIDGSNSEKIGFKIKPKLYVNKV